MNHTNNSAGVIKLYVWGWIRERRDKHKASIKHKLFLPKVPLGKAFVFLISLHFYNTLLFGLWYCDGSEGPPLHLKNVEKKRRIHHNNCSYDCNNNPIEGTKEFKGRWYDFNQRYYYTQEEEEED